MLQTITPNRHYTLMADSIHEIRTAVKGSFFVKKEGAKLLPHPSAVDTQSPMQVMRYKQYKDNAEFPEYTATTMKSMISKMKIHDTVVDIDPRLEYLIDDCDGDGTSLKGVAESCVNNILPVKWHFLLADYQGLSSIGLDEVSIEDVEKANPRATIKQYSRENVLQWSFARRHGRMQLTYVLLRECGIEMDENGTELDVVSYLKLGVDEEGYYQQKLTEGDKGYQEGERNYMSVGGQLMMFIPFEIASDEELTAGEFPLDTGFLTPIADQAYYRYRASADYKEALASLHPTLNVYGVTPTDWEDFKTVNGRNHLANGSLTANIFTSPDTKVELLESNMSLQQYTEYFEANTTMTRANGGIFNSDSAVQRTATEVINEAETSTAVLTPVADSIESAIRRCILYCGMFESIYSMDDLESNLEDITFSMPREFAASKLTVEEVKEFNEMLGLGTISVEEHRKIMEVGGWLEAEELL